MTYVLGWLPSMKNLIFATTLSLISFGVFATELDVRATFDSTPVKSLDSGLKRAQKEGKKVLVFAWDSKFADNGQPHRIGMMMGTEETKKLVEDNFEVVLIDELSHKSIVSHLGPDAAARLPQFIVFDKAGKPVKTGMVIANPIEGLRIVKELVAMP